MSCRTIVTGLAILASVGMPSGDADAQTTINPDVSVIGDVRVFSHSDDARPAEAEEFNLADPTLELGINGYLNPYARADLFVAWEGEESAAVEELYITFLRGLPLDAQIRAGRYRAGFGALNPVHPHAYSFINTPLSHAEFIGEEGLIDVGVQVSLLVPTGEVYSTVAVDALKGDFVTGHHHGKDDTHEYADTASSGQEDEAEGRQPLAFLARWTSFVALTDLASLQLGLSGVTARDEHDRRFHIGGIDAKYKWRPSRYQSLTIHGELARSRRKAETHDNGAAEGATVSAATNDNEPTDDVTSWGGFAYLDYQFRQRYNVGAILDWSQEATDSERSRWRTGAFVGFAPVEETSLLRLLVDYNDSSDDATASFWTATLQLVFSLGPHTPHSF